MPTPDGPQFNPTHDWQNAGGVEWQDTGSPEFPEYRHYSDWGVGDADTGRSIGGYEYLVRHEPESRGDGADNPWVTSIWDDSGRYDTVSGRSATLADAQSLAVSYRVNEWRRGSDYDLSRADDLGDLIDPQNDTYVEEGTHGGTLLAAALPVAAALGRKALGAAAVSGGMKAGANIADKLTGGGGSTDY